MEVRRREKRLIGFCCESEFGEFGKFYVGLPNQIKIVENNVNSYYNLNLFNFNMNMDMSLVITMMIMINLHKGKYFKS